MATKLANFGGPNPHTSGLFADMTVDGPEIGTLVLVIDRAKNLPNRKTMGKQNPYCAARLGKEAKKTETDQRGGQTPRWDQELRFTVHESPDYYKLEISILSEDKRTDLIGEAWVNLTDILTPGGGKSDFWQGLNYKGKYAGDIRIELTYYDARPKPEPAPESVVGMEDLRQSVGSETSRVKRRPLPSNPNSRHVTPDTILEPAAPGRAKHGPRDFRSPARANSMPPETMMYSQHHDPYADPAGAHSFSYGSSPGASLNQTPPTQHYGEYEGYQEQMAYEEAEPYSTQPDFLPQLPPSNRQRRPLPPPTRFAAREGQPIRPRPLSHIGLPHSHSAPMVPQSDFEQDIYDDGSQLRTDYPEPIPDLNYQHRQIRQGRSNSDINSGWNADWSSPPASQRMIVDGGQEAPPPPPIHSNSAPVVPHFSPGRGHSMPATPLPYGSTPPSGRYNSVPNSSPLQDIERTYGTPQRTPVHGHPPRGRSMDGYGSSPEQFNGSSSTGQTSSSYSRPQPAPRPLPHRNSIADPYHSTPPRPHPLSKEVPRPRSPQPYSPQEMLESSSRSAEQPHHFDYRGRDGMPLIKPRPGSPQPAQPSSQPNSATHPRSSYTIQHPVRAFESSDESPLATSRPSPASLPQTSSRSTPARKAISPNPTPPHSAGAVPFSPDSFNVHNPHASHSTLPEGNSPHSPYQVRPGSASLPRDGATGPIVGWHGQEIDPSDHLPVDSWAPEPEKKVPTKTYGLGRERDFGPRSAQNAGGTKIGDTVITMRMKSNSQPPPPPPEPEPPSPGGRNRLQKKSGGKNPLMEPLRERHNYNSTSVPDPYTQQEYSRGFYQDQQQRGGYNEAPPMNHPPTDVLAREISNIDIGSGRNSRGVPPPTAYVPVRSHKDRNTFY